MLIVKYSGYDASNLIPDNNVISYCESIVGQNKLNEKTVINIGQSLIIDGLRLCIKKGLILNSEVLFCWTDFNEEDKPFYREEMANLDGKLYNHPNYVDMDILSELL